MRVITDQKKIDEILNRGTIVKILPSKNEFRNALLSGKRLRFYIGFDATAPALHLSHAKNFMLMEKFRKLGHEVIILFGDFTARIGDPTGEISARRQLSRQEVLKNIGAWKKIIAPLMNFKDKHNPPKIMYNHKWLSKLTLENLIELTSNFTVQQFLERDMFQKRIKENKPIFLHEFLYPLMQGYDSVAMNVDVEVCGIDQIFNSLVGRFLVKKLRQKEKFVVAVTLMENPKTGELMSKSKGTGVFLNVSADDLYGQIMSQPDEMIELLFINNTYLPLDEIEKIKKMENPRDAKMRLAFEITKIFHGEKTAQKAEKHFIRVFQKKQIPEKIPQLFTSSVSENIVDLLCRAKLAPSKSEAKRLIAQGAIKLNGEKILNPEEKINLVDKEIILQKGKRQFLRVVYKQ